MAPIGKKALLIGVEQYDDQRFARLPSCRADVWHLKQVLEHRSIGGFDSVRILLDPTATAMRQQIREFLEETGPDDLALLYVSGHGVRLSRSTGEFFFVARDTDFEQVAETAVSAGYVNDLLESCRPPQKVAVIDCCQSGGFAVGFRTRDAKGGQPPALNSRGVYVLSSSGAGESSYSGPVGADGVPAPSAFTNEIVEALRTGHADTDGDGKISVEELFHFVNGRVRSLQLAQPQTPVSSSHGVNSKIILAGVSVGGAIRLESMPADLVGEARAAAGMADAGMAAAGMAGPNMGVPARRPEQWSRLLDYYRRCLVADESAPPLLDAEQEGALFTYLHGQERYLSGMDAEGQPAIPPEAAELVRQAAENDDELWAGYPVVLLYGPADRPWRAPRFAPLLVRRLELVETDAGPRLEPYGPVQPNPVLIRRLLDKEAATHLRDEYCPTWHAGNHAQMAKDIRALLTTELEVACVQDPHPEQLDESLDLRTPAEGARNVAILLRTARSDKNTTAGLLKDLAHIATRTAEIDRTALGALLPEGRAGAARAEAHQAARAEAHQAARAEAHQAARAEAHQAAVTPLPSNEAQQAVIASAMTSPLTVATGPPGTGKSQLVVNMVATCVARGQRVLVASTNNRAVDEVWERCQRLSPGLLIRTGSRSGEIDYAQVEVSTLTELLKVGPPTTTVATANAALTSAGTGCQAVRAEMGAIAELERELYAVAVAREELAGEVGWTPGQFAERLDAGDLARWHRRAVRCAAARFLARWRRRRLLGQLGHPGEPTAEICRSIARYIEAEQRWRSLRARAGDIRDDRTLAEDLRDADRKFNAAAGALVDTVVRESARSARGLIDDRLRDKQSGQSGWGSAARLLSRLRGWAVTSLSVRQFPPNAAMFDLVIVDEASQCSIPQVLPLLFRARRALIIGDAMQLTHITEIDNAQEAAARRGAGVTADWLEEHRLAYRRHSAFRALEHATGGSRLLDEHYRCHPDIARVANELFYGGQLTVLTDVRAQRRMDRQPVIWVPVNGRPARAGSAGGGQSWVNDAEAGKVNQCVGFLLEKLPAEATVGVVTPYKAQADRLAARWRDEPRVRVGTAHTFQGGERDAIVLSLVAGETMPSSSVGWLEAQRNLWNVAITRARAHLLLVGDRDYWDRRRGIGSELVGAASGGQGFEASERPLLQRLFEGLSRSTDAKVTLDRTVSGYRVDALVESPDGTTMIMLDEGFTSDPVRHLRLQLHRLNLLDDAANGLSATRLPAWRLFDGDAPAMNQAMPDR